MCKEIRALFADEIECRVSQCSASGAQLLLYKDARCDKRILDEIYDSKGWKNDYRMIGNDLFCTISIWDDKKQQWIDKTDCGIEGNSGEVKSTASDAFKRAAFNIGIGRELYTKIFIWLKVETVPKSNGKGYELKDRFAKWYVKEIVTDEEREKITALKIADAKTNEIVYTYAEGKKTPSERREKTDNKTTANIANALQNAEIKATAVQIAYLDKIYTGASLEKLLKVNGVTALSELPEIYCAGLIKRIEAKAAKNAAQAESTAGGESA